MCVMHLHFTTRLNKNKTLLSLSLSHYTDLLGLIWVVMNLSTITTVTAAVLEKELSSHLELFKP